MYISYMWYIFTYNLKRNKMKKIIGFATQFYTLWDYEAVPQYKTDSYGNHHQTGVDHKFYYIKNISTDIEKVKALFPTVEIDDQLRGKTNSFSYNEKMDLPEGYFWGGKYEGKLIEEIMESDFQYCLWGAENYGELTSKFIKNHPKYKAHFEAIEKAEKEKINSVNHLKVGDVIELDFVRNGYNADDDYTECFTEATYGDMSVIVGCSGVKPVDGMYPYLMPVINGKAQKTKNKKITVTVIEVEEPKLVSDYYGNENIEQFIRIA